MVDVALIQEIRYGTARSNFEEKYGMKLRTVFSGIPRYGNTVIFLYRTILFPEA